MWKLNNNYAVLLAISVVIIGCCSGPPLVHGLDFGYDGQIGPAHWGDHYSTCHGKYQSPINIDVLKVVEKNFTLIDMKGFNKPANSAELINNGHTVLVNLKFDETPTISGGPLAGKGTYKFAQFHFHWGDNDTMGSEDYINNKAYPAELHMVFFNAKYNSVNEALTYDDGIAVLAFFYWVKPLHNQNYIELTDLLAQVREPNKHAAFANPPKLQDLITSNVYQYYTYTGSLTTPPCSEDVIWIDFENPVEISPEQLQRFRSLYTQDGLPLKHNFRPLQPLNNRTVYKSVPLSDPAYDLDEYVNQRLPDEISNSFDQHKRSQQEYRSNNATTMLGNNIFYWCGAYLICYFFKFFI